MNSLNRTRTFYENNLNKKILELKNDTEYFNIEKFLIWELKNRIKMILENEILWFNQEAIEESKSHFYGSLKNIFKEHKLENIYDNKNEYIKEIFSIIWKQSENYTYVWDPDDIPYKINEMKNKINNIKNKYWV